MPNREEDPRLSLSCHLPILYQFLLSAKPNWKSVSKEFWEIYFLGGLWSPVDTAQSMEESD